MTDPAFELVGSGATFAALLSDTLPITGWRVDAHATEDGADLVPVVTVSAAGRPDLADLPRVVALEGRQSTMGTAWYFWESPAGLWCLLDVMVYSPARCRFALAFTLQQHRPVLEALGGGWLILAVEGAASLLPLYLPGEPIRALLRHVDADAWEAAAWKMVAAAGLIPVERTSTS